MIDYLLAHRRFQVLLIALLLVAGSAAISGLARSEDPHITNRIAIVTTFLPGASAERVEAQVSEKIEQKLKSQAQIKHLEAVSKPGISVIKVELIDEVTNSVPVWSRLRDLLADVQSQLPQNASAPQLDDERGYAYTRIVALKSPSGLTSINTINRYAKELQNQLRNVSGVELIHLFGAPEEEFRVEVDTAKAAARNISLMQITNAIQGADAKVAAGTLISQQAQIQIEIAGALTTLERIKKIPIQSTGQARQVVLSDIATITRTVKTPSREIALIDGQQGIYLGVRMLADRRVDKWSLNINQQLEQFATQLPQSIELQTIFDQQGYTQTRLGELVGNITLGFILILSVLFVTLGYRAALIVGLALPLTVLFTLICMQAFGLPIHQMSVTGLVVALGIMVDNAIVITDAVQRNRQQGMSVVAAVKDAVSHFYIPLLGSTLTTILAFAPIVLMPGPSGEFVGGIALSVIFALIGSYLISHTLIAVFAGQFIKTNNKNHFIYRGIRATAVSDVFKKTLHKSLSFPKTTLLLVFILPVAGFISAGKLAEQFFPPSDRDMFHIEVRLAPYASTATTLTQVKKMDQEIRQFEGIEKLDWMIGNNFPSFYYNMLQGGRGSANYAQAMVKVNDFETANELIVSLQAHLDNQFPEAQTIVRKLEQGPPFNAPIEVRLYGPSLEKLDQLGREIRTLLAQNEYITHTRPTILSGSFKLWLNTDETVLSHSGLRLTDMANQLQMQYGGITAANVLEQTETIPVVVRVNDQDRNELTDLYSAKIQGKETLLVESFATGEIKPTFGLIQRRDGERMNVIEGYLQSGVLPHTVLTQFEIALKQSDFTLPNGYRLEIGGESQKRNEAVGKLLGQVGIIVVLLITVLVMAFNSFSKTLLILITALQAAMLGILSVFLGSYPFGFTVIIGLLGLMGLAINAAIVILSELDANNADTDVKTIADAVMTCSRHISSTTITTVGGFMPLILAGGGFWPPFAVAIAGGTVLTTLLSFFFVPTSYLLIARHKERKRLRRQSAIPAS